MKSIYNVWTPTDKKLVLDELEAKESKIRDLEVKLEIETKYSASILKCSEALQEKNKRLSRETPKMGWFDMFLNYVYYMSSYSKF